MKNKIIYSYLIEDTRNNLYKIGKSNDPINRLKNFKVSNPFVKLIGVSFIEEKYLHSVYFKYRVVGEWFNFSNEIKSEVFKIFKPINKIAEKNKNYILNDYFINESVILNELVILDKEKNYKAISNLTGLIYEKIGAQNYRKLLAEDDEFNRIVSSAIYMSL